MEEPLSEAAIVIVTLVSVLALVIMNLSPHLFGPLSEDLTTFAQSHSQGLGAEGDYSRRYQEAVAQAVVDRQADRPSALTLTLFAATELPDDYSTPDSTHPKGPTRIERNRTLS